MKRITISVPLVLFCAYINAQQAFTNSGPLQIHSGASLAGFGNFTNASSGALINNGSLYLKGNLTNDQSSMASGSGTLYLNGTSAQSINGSQLFKTYNLSSDNSPGITLNNDLSVTGTHTFTSGIITTSSTPNYLVYESGSSYGGDGDSRHVNGWVKKFGSTNFVFPVGNGTVERTIALNSLSGSSEFSAKYFATTPNPDQMQLPLMNVDNVEYWSIQKVSGGTASVAMNWDYNKVAFPNWVVADIRVAGYNGSLWISNGGSASGSTTATGTITSNSISSFNLFTFGSQSFLLPLTLISFNATRHDNYTRITWTTEGEYNTDHFVAERSDDGVSFYAITQLPARNSGITEQYNTRDFASINNIAYYRLRSVDKGGKETFSRIVTVKVSSPDDLLTLLVNPVHDEVILAASNSLKGVFNYSIHAINGQLVQEGKLVIQNGGGQYTLPLKKIPEAGAYTLKISNELQSFRYKLIIQ